MRRLRLRFSVRSMMVVVVVVALLMYGRRVQQHRLSLARLCGIADQGVRHTGASYRLDHDAETLWTMTYETPARTPAEIEARRRRSAYWIALKQKYERAANRPWLPVEPAPPEPQ
jgi:hypothetical protein